MGVTADEGPPRRLEVVVGSIVVDDALPARPRELAAAIERELARVAADGLRPRPAVKASAAPRAAATTADGVGAAVALAVARVLAP